MRKIEAITIHCADTPEHMDIGMQEINEWHKDRGFLPHNGIYCGYHQVIRRSGMIEIARPDDVPGIHVAEHNAHSLGVCLVGRDSFTDYQWGALRETLYAWIFIHKLTPSDVYGHYEFNSQKTCPNFLMPDYRKELWAEWRLRNGIP